MFWFGSAGVHSSTVKTLDCDLVKAELRMGVRPLLMIEGIAVVVGNGLAGSCVWTDVPPPVQRLLLL